MLNNVFLLSTKTALSANEEQFLIKNYLSEEECRIFSHIKDPKISSIYLQSNAFKRKMLSETLQEKSANIDFYYNHYGKPFLVRKDNTADIFFNLSHTNGLTGIIISNRFFTGIDIEYISSENYPEAFIREVLHADELTELFADQKMENQQYYFFKNWVIKECYLKAIGNGFSDKLSSIRIKKIKEQLFSIEVDNSSPTDGISIFHQAEDNFSIAFSTNKNGDHAVRKFIFNIDFVELK